MKFFKKRGHYQVIFCEKEVITRSGDEENLPYLIRFTLLRMPGLQILFHKFLISDDDCLHDHPWPFHTFLLWGGYYEWSEATSLAWYIDKTVLYHNIGPTGEIHVKRRFKPGTLLYRPAEYKHRVELIDGKPAYSMVITRKPTRSWGFWTSKGFINHRDYSSQARCQ